LKHLPSPSTDRFHNANVPWQRVINSKGGISPRLVTVVSSNLCCLFIDETRRGPSAASHQADALRREGVEVTRDAMGQYSVDMAKYGWFPDILPSEAGLVESSDEEDDAEAAAYHT
jgi:methylated-DNA-protein-cysteine methyltransferase-like protein